MRTLRQDVLYGLRLFKQRPAFTLIVVLTMALGIGINAAIFSVARGFLLNPVSLPHLDGLVMLLEWAPQRTDYWNSVSAANYMDWREQVNFMSDMAAFTWQEANLTGDSAPERLQGFRVSHNFFQVLGVAPQLGRAFWAEEDQPGREQEVILSHGLWQRRFGSRREIVGSVIRLNDRSYAVVGVMPKDFDFPLGADLWTPLAMDSIQKHDRKTHSLVVFGRVKPGLSLSQARAGLEGIAQRLAQTYASTNQGWGVRVMPLRQFVNGSVTRQLVFLLMGGVAFVLLIVCVNITNLQLVLSTARRKEISIRLAIGAGKWRIVRQLLTESVLLGLAGGVTSLAFAAMGLKTLLAHAGGDMARYVAGWNQIKLDGATFGFSLGLGLLAGILSGTAPALSSWRVDLNKALREGQAASGSKRRRYLRNAFVITQVSLSLVLLAGAAMMTKSFWTLSRLHRHFEPKTLLTMRINLEGPKYRDRQTLTQFYDQLLQQLQVLPGVKSAAVAGSVPFANNPRSVSFTVEGRPVENAADDSSAVLQSVSPSYFRTLGIAFTEGTNFADGLAANSPEVVIVSRNLARRYWPQESPLGKRLALGRAAEANPWKTVVGVVEDVQYDWTDPGPEMTIYLPYAQFGSGRIYVVMRSAGEGFAALYPAARNRVAAMDVDVPVFQEKTLDELIADSMFGLEYVAVFVAILGFIALFLAILGVYGIMAQNVGERLHEISVRLALGAQPRNILGLVLGRGAALTVVGLVVGLVGATALARLLSGFLSGLTPTEAPLLGAVSSALALAALLACYFPARKASQVDPKAVLRE